MTIESNRQDIVPIQMLRGIAASMIVFVHLDVQLRRFGYGSYDTAWLGTGVDIFFVISGFIMWVSLERRPGTSPGEFFRNRVIRIVPLYWLMLAGVLAVAFAAPQLLHSTVLDVPHVLASFLFLPMRHPVTGQFWPLLIPGWTLNYEMLFYVLFAAAIAGANRSARARLIIIAGLITAVVLLGTVLQDRIDVMHFYARPIMFEFLAGIIIGIVYVRRQVRTSGVWFAALAGGFFLLWFGSEFGTMTPIANLIGAALVVAGGLFSPAIPVPGLKALGDASYSLYLTHVVVLAAFSKVWAAGLQSLGAPPFVAIALVSCAAAAVLCFRFVERPATLALKRIWLPSVRRAPAV